MGGKVLLSFDVEEFDLPREHGGTISIKKGAKVSADGLKKILDVLKNNHVRATFFCTVNFAKEQPELIRRLIEEKHEVACHGVDHFKPTETDAKECKEFLKKKFEIVTIGWRQPRMQTINYSFLKDCGFKYDSSVNPAFIPGRYNNMRKSRKPYLENGVLEIPTSVATILRVPLFWLALHLFPVWMYIRFAKMSLKKTGLFATYFHPWEFANLSDYRVVPWYIKRNSGDKLVRRLDRVVKKLKKKNDFVIYRELTK